MKAEWTDNTDKQRCLCCQQFVARGRPVISPDKAAAEFALLEALGFTREMLLTKHRHQIDFQLPGLAEWLQGQ
jgi:hypothetical protein